MDRRVIAGLLAFVGIMFLFARSLNVMPENIAFFAGIGCLMASGVVWSIMRPRV